MTITEKAFTKVLQDFAKAEMEKASSSDPITELFSITEDLDPEFVRALCNFTLSCFLSGRPLDSIFVHGILFYHLFLKYKQIEELEQWNKEKNV